MGHAKQPLYSAGGLHVMAVKVFILGRPGSGKTTLIKNLKKKATDFNLTTHGWRETELGKKLWKLLNEAQEKKENNLPSNWSYIFFILVDHEPLSDEEKVYIDKWVEDNQKDGTIRWTNC